VQKKHTYQFNLGNLLPDLTLYPWVLGHELRLYLHWEKVIIDFGYIRQTVKEPTSWCHLRQQCPGRFQAMTLLAGRVDLYSWVTRWGSPFSVLFVTTHPYFELHIWGNLHVTCWTHTRVVVSGSRRRAPCSDSRLFVLFFQGVSGTASTDSHHNTSSESLISITSSSESKTSITAVGSLQHAHVNGYAT